MPSSITVRFASQVIEAIRSVAAAEILPRYRSVVATRKDDGSLVTEADLAAQLALQRRLQLLEPIALIAEEMEADEQRTVYEQAGRYWCLDPLDGTANFSAGIPFFAVSVALVEGGRPVFGTVYDPIADEAFYAVAGAGAWMNHRPLVVPAAAPPLSAAVAEVSLRREIAWLRGPLKRRRPYARRMTSGSSALSWCHLAAARTDVMLHGGQKMWDYAAGALILEEAGGRLSAVEQDDFWAGPVWSRSVIAARSQPLLEEWRAWIRNEMQGPAGKGHAS